MPQLNNEASSKSSLDLARAQILRWRQGGPALFAKEACGSTPEPWQWEASRLLVEKRKLSIRSGHGVGKSAFEAWTLLWFMCCYFPCKVPTTAPTAHQLQDVLWAELAKWHKKLPPELANQFDWTAERFELREAPRESFAVARTSRKENPEALQGFHAENLMFLIDEASGVPEEVFVVAEGALSTEGAFVVMAGNPTRTSGYFYDSHHRMRSRFGTIQVNGEDVSFVSRDYIEDMRLKYGRDSNVYRVRVLGDFPTSDDDAVIPLDLCIAATERDVQPSTVFETVWGVDVARFGDDRTALAKRNGNVLLEPIKSWRQKDTMQVAGLIAHEYRLAEDKPSEILVDVIGIGAGVVDRCRELGLPVRGVNVAESPAVKEAYMRLRDELWFRAREWFDARACKIPQDDDLIAELTLPKYKLTSSGKLLVESKDEMKKRGVVSPDLADAFCLTFAGGTVPKETEEKYGRRYRRGTGWAA